MKLFKSLALVIASLSGFVWAETIAVYKSPTCGCCTEWVKIMEKAGHTVDVYHPADLMSLKQELGVPRQLGSCHTAVINDFVFEGHIPEADILAFLENPPEGAKGLAVPGMPGQSPGMARPGEAYSGFNVIEFNDQHQLKLFNRY